MTPQIKFSELEFDMLIKSCGWNEISKMILDALSLDTPSTGINELNESNILGYAIPEIKDLEIVQSINSHTHKNIYLHTLKVLDNVANVTKDLNVRFAALLHDIGKPKVKKYKPGVGWTFYGHDIVGADMTSVILDRLDIGDKVDCHKIRRLVRLHMRPITLVDSIVTDSAIRRLITESGQDLDDLMILANADVTTSHPDKASMCRGNLELVNSKLEHIKSYDRLRTFKNPINGNYIMELFGIEPCNIITILKDHVRDAILSGKINNTFEDADAYMRLKAKEIGLEPKIK